MHRAEAFMAIHDPVDRKNFDNALQTLRYEEALICQTALVKITRCIAQIQGYRMP